MKTVYILFSIVVLAFTGCGGDKIGPDVEEDLTGTPGCTNPLSENYNPSAEVNDGSCETADCSKCDFFISGTEFGFDAKVEGVQPGDIICLDASVVFEKPVEISNVKGTDDNPVIIINCGGKVRIDMAGRTYAMKFVDSQHLRVTGTGSSDDLYGLELFGSNNIGLQMDYLTSNFEIDHVEVHDVGFAGIMAKTDPSCDDATIRGNFTMRDVKIHDNYVHDTGGEGFYVGNSFYANGKNLDCGVRLPHDIENVDIYRNIVKRSGWESIQLGAGVKGARVFDNYIEDYGKENKDAQNNGIQIGEGTGGLCFNNMVNKGPGSGIIVLGLGDNVVFNNIIIDAGKNGIFCDSRYSPGDGFSFINNTIINPSKDGINITAADLNLNNLINNLIINPGNYDVYENDPTSYTGIDSYIFAANPNVRIEGNYFTRDITEVMFVDVGGSNYSLKEGSPVIDQGVDVSSFGVTFDFEYNDRPINNKYDPGAYEKQ